MMKKTKKYTWCFMGQVHSQGSRFEMIEALKKTSDQYYCNINSGWQSDDSLDTRVYREIMEQSIFIPCPRGNSNVDTFRLYEALEVGSIPIVEKSQYWRNLFGDDCPIIEVESWENAINDIQILSNNQDWLDKYSSDLCEWWSAKKNDIKNKINYFRGNNSQYHVCFCCDKNLIQYAINPINSICEKNKDHDIVIHFIYSGEESDLNSIEKLLAQKSNVSFEKYVVDSLDISVDKTWRSIEHLSSATNLKLQIPEILKDVDRIIYFDIDTIPYVDLGEFDSVKTDICGIAMRQEIKNGWRTFNGSVGTPTENKNPVDFGDRVIGNSGVMVLDLERLRKDNFTDICLKEKNENNYKIPLTGGDQDLINIFCKCYFNELPDKLNILVSDQLIGVDGGKFKFKKFIRSTNQGIHLLKNEGEESSDGGVLHFIGKDKPWNSDCLGYKFWSEFNTNSPKIPKKIFQTWKTKDLNDGLTLLSKSFRDKNPGYEYFLYDDDDCRKLIEENFEPIVLEVYDRIIPGAFKADLWRCCALYIEGGIFCDMDMICMKSFDSIINDDIEFFAPIDSNSKGAHDLYNAFMGSVPGHPILKRCIDTIVDNVVNETWRKKKQPPLDFSACGVLGRSVNNYIGMEDFSSFTGKMGVHDSVKVLNYVKEHRYVEDKEGNKYVWSKDGNKKIRMIVRQAEKEYKAEPWILSVVGGKIPYKQKQNNVAVDPHLKIKQQQLIQLTKQWQDFVSYDFLEYIEREMIKPIMPSEKFSVYNPGKKIAVVSLYTREIADYAVCSEKSIREYCERQGYTFYVYREKLDANGSANWSKARAILNHIDDHEDIVWMDSDTIIFNPEKRFEDILARCTATKKIIACEDIGTNNKKLPKGSMLNSGVLIFRNHLYTKNLIKKWMNFDGDKSSLYASGGDQEILCDILKKSDGFGFNRKVFPMNEFNTEPRFVDENTFIVHFMAYPRQLKTIFMNYFTAS